MIEETDLFEKIIHKAVMFAHNIQYGLENIGVIHHPLLGNKLWFSLQFEWFPELQTEMVCNHCLSMLNRFCASLDFFLSIYSLYTPNGGVLLLSFQVIPASFVAAHLNTDEY